MKLVIISSMRNESDIIETFVRYHLQIADRMIIVNHRSVDASAQILEQLQKEGLPIEVIQEQRLDFQQGRLMTKLLQKAVNDYDADWVLPLDADEFIAPAEDGDIRAILPQLNRDRIAKIPWRTYIPLPTDDGNELNPLKRIQYCRRSEKRSLHKILVPRRVALQRGGCIDNGNHGFTVRKFFKKKEFDFVEEGRLVLAHFPVRSARQITAKAFVGWLACLAKPDRQPTENYHLQNLFNRFKNGSEPSPEELSALALGYAMTESYHADELKELVHKPLLSGRLAFELRYSSGFALHPVSLLAQLAEEFAETSGLLRNKLISGGDAWHAGLVQRARKVFVGRGKR